MGVYTGLDMSLDAVAICVFGEIGEVLWPAKMLGDPESVKTALHRWRDGLIRVGLKAGATSEWIGGHLVDEGFPIVCLESRHVKAALSAMTVRTDRNDAQGIAQIIRTDAYPDGGAEGSPTGINRQEQVIRGLLRPLGAQTWGSDARSFRGRFAT